MESMYYNVDSLLNKLDINNKKPEVFIITGNRSAGKTTDVTHKAIDRFILKGKKVAWLYRYNYELDDVANKIFKDVQGLFYPNLEFSSRSKMKNIYHELYIGDKSIGYAISINSADQIKKNSHLFSDIDLIIFDEFQSETSHYCNNEIQKFVSIHTSIARGQGSQVRYVPIIMMSNTVSLINPYFVELDISNRLRPNTKFLKGDGWVLEVTNNENAQIAQLNSAFNRAFSKNEYVRYSAMNTYLNDKTAFIESMSGKSNYVVTIKVGEREYAVREYLEQGIVYVDTKVDKTFKFKICVTTEDHNINYMMLKRNDIMLSNLRYYFEKGCFRFKNLECKDATLKLLSY